MNHLSEYVLTNFADKTTIILSHLNINVIKMLSLSVGGKLRLHDFQAHSSVIL